MIQTLLAFFLLGAHAQDAPLTAQAPIVIPGGAGHFDFMNVDMPNRTAFACHPDKSSFTVINLDTDAVKDVDAGSAINGIASDPAGKKVFGAGPGNALVEVDMTNWSKVGSLPLTGPGDTVLFDTKRGVVYVDNDDGTSLWVVDPASLKIVSTITIKEAPEVMVIDQTRSKIFQNIKTTNTLQVIDADARKVVAEYTLGDLTSPHGLALDEAAGKLFSVGKNGKLVILSADTGKILSTVDVVKNSDQIAYDPGLKRLYIPGAGVIDVLQITDDGATHLGTVPNPAGCHSVAVDPQTHNVWVVYSDATNSYAMKLVAKS